ncbi:acyl-CoA synthetase [Auriscalpium vulgare]|uniref:Acyl-CoA synthetase n=1 Tax=Auriscalpium vulgare TaxID=40419 RepID=A0ACB8REK7_9AGAM|nr:acyl-CoA synthetase [Auriscalpium vulgare]
MSIKFKALTANSGRGLRAHRRALSSSSVQGPRTPPLDHRPFPSFFREEILDKRGDRPALIAPRERPRAHGGPLSPNLGAQGHLAWSFGEFDRHIHALARGLLALGVKQGDRVGVVMGNNSAYAMLQWACASVGAILVTINPAYRVHELGVSHLFVVPQIRTSSYLTLLTSALPSLSSFPPGNIQEEKLPELKTIIAVDNTGEPAKFHTILGDVKCAVDFREMLVWEENSSEGRRVQELGAMLDRDDVVNLQFTSGTTEGYVYKLNGRIQLTHHNLLNNAISIGQAMQLTEEDIVCNTPPLFHCNLAAWTHGAAIVYPSEIYDAQAIVDAVVKLRCTALHGVPTHFNGVLAEVERRRAEGERLDFGQLRTGIAAGSPVPIEMMKQLIKKMNLKELTNAYGMTETSPVSFQTVTDDPLLKRTDTVGKVRPHVDAKVVDQDGAVVPIGTPGELLISGYLVQKGYWGDKEQTRDVMKPDETGKVWMHTGDKAVMDEEGYLQIVGRIKDIIIRGGENLFPVQIENALCEHPGILEAAVVSVPDEKYTEVVGAFIARRPAKGTPLSRASVRKAVWDSMNPQNAPSWVWFLGEDGVASELPKTASGKVQKHILREWSRDLAKNGVGKVQ